jgi:hypothetical protein
MCGREDLNPTGLSCGLLSRVSPVDGEFGTCHKARLVGGKERTTCDFKRGGRVPQRDVPISRCTAPLPSVRTGMGFATRRSRRTSRRKARQPSHGVQAHGSTGFGTSLTSSDSRGGPIHPPDTFPTPVYLPIGPALQAGAQFRGRRLFDVVAGERSPGRPTLWLSLLAAPQRRS